MKTDTAPRRADASVRVPPAGRLRLRQSSYATVLEAQLPTAKHRIIYGRAPADAPALWPRPDRALAAQELHPHPELGFDDAPAGAIGSHPVRRSPSLLLALQHPPLPEALSICRERGSLTGPAAPWTTAAELRPALLTSRASASSQGWAPRGRAVLRHGCPGADGGNLLLLHWSGRPVLPSHPAHDPAPARTPTVSRGAVLAGGRAVLRPLRSGPARRDNYAGSRCWVTRRSRYC